jgi:hypothetical protein
VRAAACVPEDGLAEDGLTEDGLAADDLVEDDAVEDVFVEDDFVLAVAEALEVWDGFVAVVDASVCENPAPDTTTQTTPHRPARHHRIVSSRYIVDLDSRPELQPSNLRSLQPLPSLVHSPQKSGETGYSYPL